MTTFIRSCGCYFCPYCDVWDTADSRDGGSGHCVENNPERMVAAAEGWGIHLRTVHPRALLRRNRLRWWLADLVERWAIRIERWIRPKKTRP